MSKQKDVPRFSSLCLKGMSVVFISISSLICSAQSDWQWTPLSPMPMAISNNAVTSAQVGEGEYVYSFGGIDTTKQSAGILRTAMKYDVQDDLWSALPDLPDTSGKIASAASMVDDIIYIIGGYYVFEEFPYELSSDRVHRFDTSTDTYLEDGAPLPVPIDDHVQVVWRDSLILTVTGWSDTENVPAVQIYDPFNDVWEMGTSTPSTPQFEAFGTAGSIVGDTIYYFGGAVNGSFNAIPALRKGVIDPVDPTQIEWTFVGYSPVMAGYRPASMAIGEKVFWVGGSAISYNYDGIAYNGSGGVPPLHRIMGYDAALGEYDEGLGQPFGVMDLRGIGALENDRFIIAGGMEAGQVVSDKSYLIEYSPIIDDLRESELLQANVYPTVLTLGTRVDIELLDHVGEVSVSLFDAHGRAVVVEVRRSGDSKTILHIPESLVNGTYLIHIRLADRSTSRRMLVSR